MKTVILEAESDTDNEEGSADDIVKKAVQESDSYVSSGGKSTD